MSCCRRLFPSDTGFACWTSSAFGFGASKCGFCSQIYSKYPPKSGFGTVAVCPALEIPQHAPGSSRACSGLAGRSAVLRHRCDVMEDAQCHGRSGADGLVQNHRIPHPSAYGSDRPTFVRQRLSFAPNMLSPVPLLGSALDGHFGLFHCLSLHYMEGEVGVPGGCFWGVI